MRQVSDLMLVGIGFAFVVAMSGTATLILYLLGLIPNG